MRNGVVLGRRRPVLWGTRTIVSPGGSGRILIGTIHASNTLFAAKPGPTVVQTGLDCNENAIRLGAVRIYASFFACEM